MNYQAINSEATLQAAITHFDISMVHPSEPLTVVLRCNQLVEVKAGASARTKGSALQASFSGSGVSAAASKALVVQTDIGQAIEEELATLLAHNPEYDPAQNSNYEFPLRKWAATIVSKRGQDPPPSYLIPPPIIKTETFDQSAVSHGCQGEQPRCCTLLCMT